MHRLIDDSSKCPDLLPQATWHDEVDRPNHNGPRMYCAEFIYTHLYAWLLWLVV